MSKTYIPVELREQVIKRAKAQCEYCLIPESIGFATFEIDHIVSEKHGGNTSSENLAYSCSICNKRKGTDIASIESESEELTALYNPRKQKWSHHFSLHKSGRLKSKSPIGKVTIQFLQLNRGERIKERQLLSVNNLIHQPER